MGGYFSVFAQLDKEKAFEYFWLKAVIGIAVGIISIAYRYIRTVLEERGGLRGRKAIAGEE